MASFLAYGIPTDVGRSSHPRSRCPIEKSVQANQTDNELLTDDLQVSNEDIAEV